MQRDWANLPEEMVTLIGEKASTTNRMYVHLPAVCKTWRRALTPHPCHLPRQFPWLLLPRLGVDDFCLRFYDLSQSKTHQFELPYLSGKRILGSSYGWLMLLHDYRASLLNPITRRSIDLPSLDTIYTLSEYYFSSIYWLEKLVLSCNPSEPDCVVVGLLPPLPTQMELIFCRVGDTRWTGLQMFGEPMLLNFTLHNNLVYKVNFDPLELSENFLKVSVLNLQSLTEWTYPSKIKYDFNDLFYLVEGDAESDGPFVIKRSESEYMKNMDKIYVYKWFNGQEQQWRQVRDIANRVLFLNCDNFTNLKLEIEHGNKIYYDVIVRHYLGRESFRVGINLMNYGKWF